MAKHVFDITVALIRLIVLAPAFTLIAVLVKCDSPDPLLFRGKPVGQR